MSHQDRPCPLVINHQTIKQVIDWLLAPPCLPACRGERQATWKPRMLAAAALLWATSELSTLHERFAQASKIIAKVFRWQPAPGGSYQGFLKMLAKWQPELLGAVVPHLRDQMQEVLPGAVGDGGLCGVCRGRQPGGAGAERVVGSGLCASAAAAQGGRGANKTAAARRSPKKQAAAARHKKATSPQLWLTLLWHVGSGLPWAWRTGPSGASERDQLVAMVPELPAHALMVADAGFVGYDFWQTLLTRRPPLRDSRGGQRAARAPARLDAGARAGRLFVARPGGAQAPAPAGVAPGGRPRWQAAGVSGDRLTQEPLERPPSGDDLRRPVGCGSVLPHV